MWYGMDMSFSYGGAYFVEYPDAEHATAFKFAIPTEDIFDDKDKDLTTDPDSAQLIMDHSDLWDVNAEQAQILVDTYKNGSISRVNVSQFCEDTLADGLFELSDSVDEAVKQRNISGATANRLVLAIHDA